MKIAIAVLTRTIGYADAWKHLPPMMQHLSQSGHQVLSLSQEGSVIGRMRGELAQAAMDADCDAVCFIDDDEVFTPDSVTRLLSWNAPVVGGLYPTRYAPYRSTCLISSGTEGNYRSLHTEEIRQQSLVPVDVVSLGFSVIRRSVFETLPRPWFKQSHVNGQDVDECMHFNALCRDAGIPLSVDTGVRVGHLTVVAAQFTPNGQVIFAAPSLVSVSAGMPEQVGV
ncbi:MAG TPA: hypothetical protein VNH18_32645 [Bryobacteraceae bacterium]|nr:hypothetical protein [Bryobacteraceae bacterium]